MAISALNEFHICSGSLSLIEFRIQCTCVGECGKSTEFVLVNACFVCAHESKTIYWLYVGKWMYMFMFEFVCVCVRKCMSGWYFVCMLYEKSSSRAPQSHNFLNRNFRSCVLCWSVLISISLFRFSYTFKRTSHIHTYTLTDEKERRKHRYIEDRTSPSLFLYFSLI